MRQTASGRWVPEREPKPKPPVPLYEQYGIDLAQPMPWWYPLMHFEAMVGRSHMGSMDFGEAIRALKDGQRVGRRGWNGKNMWLVLVPGSEITVESGRPLGDAVPSLIGKWVTYQPHIDMWTADGKLVPWLASQTDVLAEDWEVVSA